MKTIHIKPQLLKLGELGERLPKLTMEEVIFYGIGHLLALPKASSIGSDCVYKGSDALCCAAAPFISHYHPEMEEIDWLGLVSEHGQSENHQNIIVMLQTLHDDRDFWMLSLDSKVERINRYFRLGHFQVQIEY